MVQCCLVLSSPVGSYDVLMASGCKEALEFLDLTIIAFAFLYLEETLVPRKITDNKLKP